MDVLQLEDYLANPERLEKLLREVNRARVVAKKSELSIETVRGEYVLALAIHKATDETRSAATQALIDYQVAHDL